MTRRVIIFLFSFLVLGALPFFCSKAMPVPTFQLTIQVNTQGQEGLFNYNLKLKGYEYNEETEEYVEVWNNYQQFVLQTNGLTAQTIYTDMIGMNLMLEQEVAEGFKLNGILCTSNKGTSFWYSENSVEFTPGFGSIINCVFSNSKIVEKKPVLIVPGIMGTELEKDGELLWANIDKMLLSPNDMFMDPLAFSQNLIPSDSDVDILNVIKSKTAFDYTDGLINEFAGQGYLQGETLFTFPYDWRYGVSGKNANGKTNSDLLGEKIQEILLTTGAENLDVVAHSMGGLVVKKYVVDNPSNHSISKAIFVGVPNTGSPDAVKALVQGTNFGISFGPVGLSEREMKKLAENMPGVYDLLPSQKYYNVSGSFMAQNDKTFNYEEFENYLISEKELNQQALTNAKNLHTTGFDDYDLRTAGVDLYAIDGCRTATMTKFYETKQAGGSVYNKINYKIGDGTVPIQSSTNLPIDSSKKFYSLKGKHSKMMGQDGIRQQIVNIIARSNLAISDGVMTQDISQCKLNGKAIEVFSPLDISVLDELGNKLALVDENIINEIDNANFLIWGEHKFVYLPNDSGEDYEINLDGIGEGNYTINVLSFLGGQVVRTDSFQNLPVTNELIGKIVLPENIDNQTMLLIKQNVNSEFETIYSGNYDTTSPVITVPENIVVETENESGVVVNYGIATAEDNIDGVVSVLCDIGSNDLFAVGKTQVTCSAKDNAGNKAEKSFNVQVNLIGKNIATSSSGSYVYVLPAKTEVALEEGPKIPKIIIEEVLVAPVALVAEKQEEENNNQLEENLIAEIGEVGTAGLLPVAKKYFWWFAGIGGLGVAGYGIYRFRI